MPITGTHFAPDRNIVATVPIDVCEAFVAITRRVFACAGHFVFLILISELKCRQKGTKGARTLQTFATTFCALFTVVMYLYLRLMTVPLTEFKLPTCWEKAIYGIAHPTFPNCHHHGRARAWVRRPVLRR